MPDPSPPDLPRTTSQSKPPEPRSDQPIGGEDSSLAEVAHQDAAAGAQANVPACFGRYRVTARLGAGGFGTVYKGRDEELCRDVAIKVPHRRRLAAAGIDAYLAEARILARLDHPGIVPVHDVGRTEDGLCYLVSKYVDGADLAKYTRQARPFPAQAVEILAQVAEALHHAHQHGLVHRDIKPANILLDASARPVVADFGLALREEDFSTGPTFAGTPAYMSPEQARGEGHRVDARTDVYSLGVVFYELLTGRRPFTAPGQNDLLEQIKTQEPRPPRQLDDTIPRELDRICLKALAKRGSERYSTAKDLAEDLRHWQKEQAGKSFQTGATPTAPLAAGAAAPGMAAGLQAPPAGTPDSDKGPVKVVPKGLRSFDAGDADFFLELLPGPRDRDGLPDSIVFWKTRIESADADEAFSVGLVYGPSGCGKSSLVKAGLLPRLADHVLPVYVEATAAETEARLLRGLQKRCGDLPRNLDLVEVLAYLRRNPVSSTNRVSGKLLIVLDQFEQWLHAKRLEQHAELMEALRQCDGLHVQCLLLVRDDFWLAVSRFLRDLEVRLLEGQNTALVDLFDPLHARKVLAAFGCAYGRLPEKMAEANADQERFLDDAVAGLVQEGKVISVRLSLFAEMIKGKPWTPETLKQVGGAEGVGVTFLEETFSAATAPAEHRLHQKAARAVLKALLPELGSDIKGNMRSRQALLEASGYARQPRDFDTLLRILDAELRLVTPTDPEGIEADDSRGDKRPRLSASEQPASVAACGYGEQYYQLTHDYLVPALRRWLTKKQRETRRGRAELRLAERSALWNSRPENRRLPAWWEWANIRFLTRKKDWTAVQQTMMRRATRYHAVRGLALAIGLVLLGLGAFEGFGRLQSAHLRDQLLNADVPSVPGIVKKMAPYRRWVQLLLQDAYAEAERTNDSPRRLYASLALLPWDPGQSEYLSAQLLRSNPAELKLIRDALQERQAPQQPFLDVLAAAREDPERRLRAACALAGWEAAGAHEDIWKTAAPLLVQQLLAEVQSNPSYYGQLVELLKPVRARLIPPLEAVYYDHGHAGRYFAATILADYAVDQPERLSDLLMDGEAKQFAALFPKVQQAAERALAALDAELNKTLSLKQAAPVPEADKDRLAKRQAAAAVGLLRLGQPAKVWLLLQRRLDLPDPRLRSYLIHWLGPRGADPHTLLERLNQEEDVSVRRALLLSLGEFTPEQLPVAERDEALSRLLDLYRDDPDPGVHGAAEWLLRQWQQQEKITDAVQQSIKQKEQRLERIQRELATDKGKANRQWYVNGQGQTMVVVPGPVQFAMGSPVSETGRQPTEDLHQRRIGRSFALAATTVTVAQFEPFLRANPRTRQELNSGGGAAYLKRYSPKPDCPIIVVSWYMAAEYCNWLSAQEGIPREQWCYEPNASPALTLVAGTVGFMGTPLGQGPLLAASVLSRGRTLSAEYGAGMKLKPDYLHRTGYRLPTESEWEYACRAEAATSRYYGESVELLDNYARFNANFADHTWPVGGLKPNDLGLFDMHGNVFSWCLDEYAPYPKSQDGKPVEDKEDVDDMKGISSTGSRLLRGGSFDVRPVNVRSAYRRWNVPASRGTILGFRPARTFTP